MRLYKGKQLRRLPKKTYRFLGIRRMLWGCAAITFLLLTASMVKPILTPIHQHLVQHQLPQQLAIQPLHTPDQSPGQLYSSDRTSSDRAPRELSSSRQTKSGQPMGKLRGVLNVKNFGAVGDGIHDDTSSIQRVLDRAKRYDALLEVYFPAGTYKVNPQNPLTVHSNTKVSGEGKDSIIRADDDEFGWELFAIEGEDIVVQDLQLDGNQAVNRVLVVRSNSSDIEIEGMTITNASQSEDVNSGYYDQVVSGIIIYGNTNDITINNSEISHLTAPHSGWIARGIYITTMWNSREDVPTHITITNNDIHHVGSADDGDCIYYEDTNKETSAGDITNSVISNNHLVACAKRAIKLYANGIDVDNNHIVNSYLHNNVYLSPSKNGVVAPDMYAGISVYGDDITVINNTLDGTGSYYAAIEVSATATVNNINILNNIIKMGMKSTIIDTTGIRVGNVRDFSISSNHIENGQRAVWLWQNAAQGIIQENSIYTPKGGGIDLTKQWQYKHNQISISDNKYRYLQY